MYTYTKIETPFNRDMDGTKKLIEGSFRNDTVEFLAPCQWYGTEKVDGTNIGVVWDGHKVSFQGRTEKSVIPNELQSALEGLFCGDTNEELFEQMFGEKEVVLFGEGYGGKIQNGGGYRGTASFILFDIYIPKQNIWLQYDSIKDIANALGIKVVPIVFTGTIDEAVSFVKGKPMSVVAESDSVLMEGIVCKPLLDMYDRCGNRIIVKVKARDFI